MGNYTNFETDFIERTITLIEQYTETVEERPFEQQLNYTLTLNCLLGLIVMPRERVVNLVPSVSLTPELKMRMGLNQSRLPEPPMTLDRLIIKMRNSIAHFSVETRSLTEDNLMDEILFFGTGKGKNRRPYAVFRTAELLPFLKYYTNSLLTNLRHQSVHSPEPQGVQ